MDELEQLQEDLRTGQIDPKRVVDLIATVLRDLQAAKQRITELEQRNAELEKQQAATAGPAKFDQPFSMRAEEKRQAARVKKGRKRKDKAKGRRGRIRTEDKIAKAERTEDVYPDGVPRSDCRLSHTRPVWRLENGRAVLVAYRVFRGPKNQYGRIPGVLGPRPTHLLPSERHADQDIMILYYSSSPERIFRR
jgi:transposase